MGGSSSQAVERYDVWKKEWRDCAPLLIPRRLHGAAVAADGRIFVFGGSCDDGRHDTAAVECYDPTADRWERRRDMPVGACTVAVSVGDMLFVALMGRSELLRYDPVVDEYTKVRLVVGL